MMVKVLDEKDNILWVFKNEQIAFDWAEWWSDKYGKSVFVRGEEVKDESFL